MARDYKSAPKSSPKKGGNPMFTGILIGLFVGLAAALAVAFYVMRSPSPFVAKEKPAASKDEDTVQKAGAAANFGAAKPAAQEAKPRFDFYTILPGTEEAVTEAELKQASQKPAGLEKDSYYLQAGAFQKESDADNLKARLALMGMEAVIQTANLPEKGILHRVRVGPYTSIDEINKVRAILAQNGMEANLIKTREPVSSSSR